MRYLLYGYGVTNKAVAQYLKEHKMDFEILVNENEIPPQSDYLFISKSKFIDKDVERFDVLIRSPGIPFDDDVLTLFKKKRIRIISEIEFAYTNNNRGIIIAITGTNGKTSTLYFLEQLLKNNYKVVTAGNNGIPYISVIDKIEDSTIVLLELSSFQLEDVDTFKPTIACITNLAPNHLDKTHSIERYYQSKMNIIKNGPVFLKNLDDINISNYVNNDNCYTYSLDKNANYYIKDNYFYEKGVKRFKVDSFKLRGLHNKYNLLVALAVCKLLNVDDRDLIEKIKDIKVPKFRNEYVTSINGVEIYNDSKSTIPESTIAAIKSFNKPVHALVGGYDKNISFEILKDLENVKFYAFGHSKNKIKSQVNSCKMFNTMDEAFTNALINAKSGEVIILSPACASFDQFKDYQERGIKFEKLVLKHKEGNNDDYKS